MDKTMGQRPPPSSLPCAPSHLTYIPTIRRSLIQQKPSKSEAPSPSLFLLFLLNLLPNVFRPLESTLQRPPHRRNHRSVGCCVDPMSSGHPRPVLQPSLNISMGAISAPQTRKPAAVGANLGAVRLQWAAAAHLVWVFGVEREENRDGGRETMIPLFFECPQVPFMILLQKHLIWMVEVINNRGRYTYYLSY
jgi:hypothetical protein